MHLVVLLFCIIHVSLSLFSLLVPPSPSLYFMCRLFSCPPPPTRFWHMLAETFIGEREGCAASVGGVFLAGWWIGYSSHRQWF